MATILPSHALVALAPTLTSDLAYRLLVQSVVDYALYLLTPEGIVANWNVGAERAKGYTTDEIIGRHFSVFYLPDDRAASLPARNLATARRIGSYRGEGWRLRKDGSRFWAHVVIDPVHAEDGSLLGFAKITRDLTEQRIQSEQLRYASRHDGLTGLPNREQLIERLRDELESGQRHHVAVIEIDLDRFKDINDSHGHAAGDRTLRELARRTAASLLEGELLARTGSDEFIALKRYGDPAELDDFVQRLQKGLTAPLPLGQLTVSINARLGVASFPQDAPDLDKLLDNASLALRRAKQDGLGGHAVCRHYEVAMDEQVRTRRSLLRDLHDGLGREEFHLVFQGQHDSRGRHAVGYEALLRWQHPKRGLVPPNEFIMLAEASGAILEIGTWVLREACAQAMRWREPLRVAVNISPLQLADTRFEGQVLDILAHTGLPPSRLELEITETALFDGHTDSLAQLHRLQGMGVHIALDDFGIGYSSLGVLHLFAFDKLKIDRSFVTGLETNPQAQAFVHAILAMAQSLSLPVLAEGVETEAQLAALVQAGCDQVQGFMFGRPDTAERLGLTRH